MHAEIRTGSTVVPWSVIKFFRAPIYEKYWAAAVSSSLEGRGSNAATFALYSPCTDKLTDPLNLLALALAERKPNRFVSERDPLVDV